MFVKFYVQFGVDSLFPHKDSIKNSFLGGRGVLNKFLIILLEYIDDLFPITVIIQKIFFSETIKISNDQNFKHLVEIKTSFIQ